MHRQKERTERAARAGGTGPGSLLAWPQLLSQPWPRTRCPGFLLGMLPPSCRSLEPLDTAGAMSEPAAEQCPCWGCSPGEGWELGWHLLQGHQLPLGVPECHRLGTEDQPVPPNTPEPGRAIPVCLWATAWHHLQNTQTLCVMGVPEGTMALWRNSEPLSRAERSPESLSPPCSLVLVNSSAALGAVFPNKHRSNIMG